MELGTWEARLTTAPRSYEDVLVSGRTAAARRCDSGRSPGFKITSTGFMRCRGRCDGSATWSEADAPPGPAGGRARTAGPGESLMQIQSRRRSGELLPRDAPHSRLPHCGRTMVDCWEPAAWGRSIAHETRETRPGRRRQGPGHRSARQPRHRPRAGSPSAVRAGSVLSSRRNPRHSARMRRSVLCVMEFVEGTTLRHLCGADGRG